MKQLIEIIPNEHRDDALHIIAKSPAIPGDQCEIVIEAREFPELEFENLSKSLCTFASFANTESAIEYIQHRSEPDEDGDTICRAYVADNRSEMGNVRITWSWPEAVAAAYEMAAKWINDRSAESDSDRTAQLDGVN